MCGRARFAILANRQIRRYTNSSSSTRRGRTQNQGTSGTSAAGRNRSSSKNQSGNAFSSGLNLPSESSKVEQESDASSDKVEEEKDRIVENVSPGFTVRVLRQENGEYVSEDMVWGLIPIFNMNEKPDHYRLFNKRIESFSNDQQYFNRLIQTKRCVVIFDGFYEWKTIAGKKQPYYVHLKEKAIQMAAIFEDFRHDFSNPYLETVSKSFAVITGHPCKSFSEVHNRQPIFLTDEQVVTWLNPETAIFPFLETLKTNPDDPSLDLNQLISFHPVTNRVTDPKYQSEDCMKPISLGKTVTSFFSRAVKDELNQKNEGNEKDREVSEPIVGVKRKIDTVDLTEEEKREGSGGTDSLPLKTVKSPLKPPPQKTKTKLNPKEGIVKFFGLTTKEEG